MTAKEMAALIGTTRSYHVTHNLDFDVLVVDARTRFGDVDVLVHPSSGFGEQWIALHKTSEKE